MEVVDEKSYWEFYGFTDEIDCLLIDLVSRNQEITDGRGGIGVTYDYAGNLGDCKGRVPFQYVSDPAPWRLTPNYDGSGESEDGDYIVIDDYDYLVSGGEDETGADSEDNAPVSGTTAESNLDRRWGSIQARKATGCHRALHQQERNFEYDDGELRCALGWRRGCHRDDDGDDVDCRVASVPVVVDYPTTADPPDRYFFSPDDRDRPHSSYYYYY